MKKKLLTVLLMSTMILASGTVAKAVNVPQSNIGESADMNEGDSSMENPEIENDEDNSIVSYSGDIAINEANFPDKKFRTYLEQFDIDEDGHFSQQEIEDITSINVAENNIASLIGINYFTNLTYLDCSHNQLTILDVSHNPKLDYIQCGNNQLTYLNTDGVTKLSIFNCENNQLKNLDLNKNVNLPSITQFN